MPQAKTRKPATENTRTKAADKRTAAVRKQRETPETPERQPEHAPKRTPAKRKPRTPDAAPQRQADETKSPDGRAISAAVRAKATPEPIMPGADLAGGRLSAAERARARATAPTIEPARQAARPHDAPATGGLVNGEHGIAALIRSRIAQAKAKGKPRKIGPVGSGGGSVEKITLVTLDPGANTGDTPSKASDGTISWGPGGGGGNANPNAAVEGVSLSGYGNSYQQVGTAICQRRYWERIHDWLRSPIAVASGAHGVSSMIASDISNYAHSAVSLTTAYATGVATWAPATTNRGVVIWEGVRNDAGWDGISTTAKSRAGFVNGLDSFLRLIRAGSSLQDTNAAFVYTGTWTNSPNVKVPGSNSHNTTTPGDHVTVTTPVGTDFDLIILGGDTTIVGPAFTVTVDGVDITAALAAAGFPVTANAQFSETKQVATCPWVPLAIPLRGLSNAAHTVVVTHAGSAGQTLFVNRLLTPSAAPPTVIINKANQLPAGGYANYVTNGNALGSPSFATDQIYNGLIDTVVARFGAVTTLTSSAKAIADRSIVVFDPMAAGWDPTTMIASTDASHIHPNDKGMGCYADGLRAALNALSPRNGIAIL